MNHQEIMDRVFAKLGEEKRLHEYSEAIRLMLGIVIDFINAEGVSLRLSQGRNFNGVCAALRHSPKGRCRCHEEDLSHSAAAAEAGKELVYTCHAGFTEIVLPLYDSAGKFIGCMTAGQFYTAGGARPADDELRHLAELAGTDVQTLRRSSAAAVVLTPKQVAGVVCYLKLMGQLVAGCYSELMFMEQSNAPDKISLVQKYIHANYMRRLSVGDVARRFYLSPSSFSRFFRRTLGTGFNNYLNCYRVEKARGMLTETNLSVAEIAFLCGFGSISQFNRTFRDVVDCSPGEWRRSRGPHGLAVSSSHGSGSL